MRACDRRLLVLIVLLWPCAAFAQARAAGGDVTGTVRDITGGVLPGTTITAANQETGVSRAATSDEAGRYLLPALPPGTYTVDATLPGFSV
jgi:hypothetical protein